MPKLDFLTGKTHEIHTSCSQQGVSAGLECHPGQGTAHVEELMPAASDTCFFPVEAKEGNEGN